MQGTSFQLGPLNVLNVTLVCPLGGFLTILGVFQVNVSLVRRTVFLTILLYNPVQGLFRGSSGVLQINKDFFRGVVLSLFRAMYD